MSHGTELDGEPRSVRASLSTTSTLTTLALSEGTVKVVTEGRISKLPHTVKVRFILREGSFFVLAGKGKSDWALNALESGTAKIRLGDLAIKTVVSETTDDERASTLAEFTKRFGP